MAEEIFSLKLGGFDFSVSMAHEGSQEGRGVFSGVAKVVGGGARSNLCDSNKFSLKSKILRFNLDRAAPIR